MFLKIFPCKGTVGNEPVEKILTTLKPIKDQPNKLEEMKNSGWDFRSYMSNVKMENLSLSRGAKYLGFFSSRSLKTRETILVLLSLYNF